MARIMVLEPSDEVRELFSHLLAWLGYEPVLYEEGVEPREGVDALLVEPVYGAGRSYALELRRRRPELPIVCASIEEPGSACRELQAAVHLVKPISLAELDGALRRALDESPG